MALDVTLARAQFPSLSGSWTYMDNAGGSQVPLQVADAVRDYLLHNNVQLGASYEPSRNSGQAVADGRRLVADWIGASPEEIIFGANSSQLLRTLALTLSSGWEPDDEVIITQGEHEANAGCWEYLEQFGIVIKTWKIDPERYNFDLAALSELFSERTRLVAVHHSSNILGNVMPIREIVNVAHGAGAQVVVDGVGFVPHRSVDVHDLGVDYYAFSPYKAFGPHLGVLYAKADLQRGLPRWNHFFFEEDDIPAKFELGSGSFELISGLTGLEKYVRAISKDMVSPLPDVFRTFYRNVVEHENKLTRGLLNFLASKPRVQVIGEADPRMAEDRLPVISFVVDGADPQELVQAIDEKHLGVRWGHFYAVRLLDALDLLQYKGVIRTSLVHYNSETEVDRFKDVLDPLLS